MHLSFAAILTWLGHVVAQSTIFVDPSVKHQMIDGFGVSQAFGRALEFQNANTSLQQQALRDLFDTESGAGFSIIRIRIGSNDSGDPGDSIEPTSPGSPNNPPSYVWDKNDKGQVWFAENAVRYGVETIYADAWGAPGFMKTSGDDSLPGYLCGSPGHPCTSGDWREAYANFLVEYVQLYKSSGYGITHLGFLNEPDFSTTYSQMQISPNASEAIDFIPILDSAVQSAGLDLELTCCDATGWDKQNGYTTELVNAGSTKYLGKITGHAYSSDAKTPEIQTSLRRWNTEAGDGSGKFMTTWYSTGALNEGFTWAQKIAVALVQADLSAYLYWEGFEIKQGQSASHLLDALDGAEVTRAGIFWAFAMWSRYIRPGAQRVSTSGTIENVIVGAFVNTDKTTVVVLTNCGTGAQRITLSLHMSSIQNANAYVTSNNQNFANTAANISGGMVSVSVPSKGVVTVTIK